MRVWTRSHVTYANVVATLALFLVLGGGTALGAYVVSSNSQIGPGTVSGHKPPSGKHANIIAGSINGTDIADRSGVDTCPSGIAKFGPICAGSDGGARSEFQAMEYCRKFGLRLPSLTEAYALAKSYNVPGVGSIGFFWTDEENGYSSGDRFFEIVDENGSRGAPTDEIETHQTVCVTDPSA